MKMKMMKKGMAVLLAIATVTAAVPAYAQESLNMNSVSSRVAAASNSSVVVTAQGGYGEGAYAEWSAVTDATGYNVYCDGQQIDTQLVRQYASCFRADVVGITSGSHTIKIVPVIGGSADTSKAAEVTVTAEAHDRSGYAFAEGKAMGAYNADGTLKSGATVIYVTESNKDSVSMTISGTEYVGFQNVLYGLKKQKYTEPVCIRVIGNITDPSALESGDILVDAATNLTIEGIGEDATLNGFGLRIKNSSYVEVRNLGFMNCNSEEGDNCGLQQGNTYCWVHNCDFFYGDAGTDADQVKGDGALDTKKSQYITHSYNHFWDSGKCNLQGASSSDTSNYITYHHNWFDHSDSRHPRIRVATVHVYNNYYDGNSKYGIGSTTDSDVFVENNYFRNCYKPMIISTQGSDTEGTLSDEVGGMIKAYGNIIEGAGSYIPYSQNSSDFDCYDASSRNEQVPSSVAAVNGGATYNNFDTASDMYSYSVDAAEDVPSIVQAKAGRVGGGDFQWDFDDSTEDKNSEVISELKAALVAYDDSIVAIGSGFTDETETPDPTDAPTTEATTEEVTDAPEDPTEEDTKNDGGETPVVPDIPADATIIYASPNGTGDGTSISNPTDVLSAIAAVPAGGVIYLLEGTYSFSEMIVIDQNNSGTADAYKTISAYPGAEVVWDFSGQGEANSSLRGVALDGSYWHWYGFEITKAADNGMLLSGNNNIIEMMVFNDNQDSGLQISRYRTDAATVAEWPSNNLVLNCTSFNNCDNATMENADGFAAKLTCGEGNVFDGCMAYNNSDDGWDLYAKEETGPIGVVTIRNCVAFRNGYTTLGEGYGDCDGNGFKLGGAGVGSAHIVDNCLAFENLNAGFTDNNNPSLGGITNSTAYNNGVGGNGKQNFNCYRSSDGTATYSELMSVYFEDEVSATGAAGMKLANDKFYGTLANSVYYNSKYYYLSSSTTTTGSSVKEGDVVELAKTEFVTLEVPAMGSDFHTLWRNGDGSIYTAGFAQTTDNGTYADLGYKFSLEYVEEQDPTEPPTTEPTEPTTEEPTTEPSEETTEDVSNVVYGDVDCNGTVNIMDIIQLSQSFMGSAELTPQGAVNADVDLNGSVNPSDTMYIAQSVVKIVTLPIEN